MRVKLLSLGLATLCLQVARAQFNPVPLTPGSYTHDIVIEKGATPPLANYVNVTMDQGTNDYGNTFFEQTYIGSLPMLGLPPHGSTFASLVANHSYQMPPSYVTNNVAFVAAGNIPGTSTLQAQVTNALLTVSDPATAYTGISLLYASGGAGIVNFTVNYTDGSSESSSFTTVDWMNTGTAAAWVAGGRVAVDGSNPLNTLRSTSQTKLFNADYVLGHTGSAIKSIGLSIAGTNSFRVCVFGVSATSDGTTYNPVAAVSGFNADAVVEAGAPCAYIQGCNVTIDQGASDGGNTFYEQGFATVTGGQGANNLGRAAGLPGTGTTGLPHPGGQITSGSYTFQMPASYVGNDCVFIGNYAAGALSNGIYATPSYLNGTVTVSSPQPYKALSLLGTAGNGPCVMNYTVHYSDTTVQTGSLSIADWFNAATAVFSAGGRVAVDGPGLNNVGNGSTVCKLYHNDIALNNNTASVTSIDLSYVSGGRAALFALSAQPTSGGNFNPIGMGGYDADVIVEKEQPFFPGGFFNATTGTVDQGTNNCNFTWFERGWATNGAAAVGSGLPPAGSTLASLQANNRVYQFASSYTAPNAVLVDTNHLVVSIQPATPVAGTALAMLTGGGSIGSGNTMTNLCILQHANGVAETNFFYGYDWFESVVAPAFIANGRGDTRYHSLGNIYGSPQNPRMFETIFTMSETVSPVTNILLIDKQLNYTNITSTSTNIFNTVSWTTFVMGVSLSTNAVPPVLGPTILSPAATYDGSNITAQATESGTTPITNQWQFSADGTNWVNLANGVGQFLNAANVANSWMTQVLTNTSVGYTNNGQYRLVASNAAGSVTNGAASLLVVSPLPSITQPSDTNSVTVFMPGGEPVAEPAAEVVGHVIDRLVGADPGKWLTFGPSGNTTPWNPNGYAVGFTVTPAMGKTTVSAIRYYTANDSQQRDPADYTLEGSNDGGSTWSVVARGLLNLPAGRNSAASGALNPLTQFLQEVRFANTSGYRMYRWSCTNVQNNATATCMQVGEIEFLGVPTPAAPVILSQSGPTIKTYVGSSPSFFVQAQGFPTNLTYQWYRDNGSGPVAIPGAISASYTLANAQLSDSGAVFSCVITNTVGSVTSANSTLSIIAAPTTTYAARIINDHPMAYFRLDEGPDDGTGGGNNGTVAYDTWGGHNGYYTNTILQQAGYSVNDPDPAAYFGKNAFNWLPTTGVPESCVEAIGGISFATTNASAAFSVEAWVQLDPGMPAGGVIPGAGIVSKGTGGGGEQFNLDLGGTGNAFRFFVRDTSRNTHGPAGTVVPEPGVWHHVVGVVDEAHSNVLLYVDGLLNASGTANPTNGIQDTAAPMTIGSRSSSASTNNNMLFYGTIDEVALYSYALSSNQVLNHFYAAGVAPRFTVQPTNSTFSEGTVARFYAPYYGSPTLAAQWYQSTDFGASWAPVAGQTASTLTLPNVTAAMNGYEYYLQVQNAYGTTNSTTVMLTVQSGPPVVNVDTSPLTTVTYAGRAFTLQAQFGGTPPITYQWFHDGSPVSNNSRVSGATSNVLTVINAQTNDVGGYYVQASNAQGGPVPSSPATVSVETIPDFNTDGRGWTIQQTANGGTRNISNDALTLTDNGGSEATSAFYSYPLYIGAFRAGYTYVDATVGGADGVAFVLQNDSRGAAALGGGGGALGLSGITPSFAVTFNVYASASGGPGMSFGLNGSQGLPYTSTAPLGIDGGDPIDVSALYQNGVLSLVLTDAVVHTSFTTNVAVDLPSILGANSAYVGFTGGDGGATSTQVISNFFFVPLPTLAAQRTSTNTVVLTWPASVGGFAVLQKASLLPTGGWTASPVTVNVVGSQNQAIVTPAGASEFYRLVLQPIEP